MDNARDAQRLQGDAREVCLRREGSLHAHSGQDAFGQVVGAFGAEARQVELYLLVVHLTHLLPTLTAERGQHVACRLPLLGQHDDHAKGPIAVTHLQVAADVVRAVAIIPLAIHHLHLLGRSVSLVKLGWLSVLLIERPGPGALEIDRIDEVEEGVGGDAVDDLRNAFASLPRAPVIDHLRRPGRGEVQRAHLGAVIRAVSVRECSAERLALAVPDGVGDADRCLWVGPEQGLTQSLAVGIDVGLRIARFVQCGAHLIGRSAGGATQCHVQRHADAKGRDEDVRLVRVLPDGTEQVEGEGVVVGHLLRVL